MLYPSLYRALKLTFLTDKSDIGTGNLGQSVRVMILADFCPVCV